MNDLRNGTDNHGARPRGGRRTALPYAKGRQVDPEEVAAVRAILGDRPRAREMLIEYLHLVQEATGCLRVSYLQALAEEIRIPMAEVYEVASFYAHFDVVHDGEDAPAPITVRVCESISCTLADAEALIDAIENENLPEVRVVRAPCMGRCDTAPVCEVGHRHIDHATAATVRSVIKEKNFDPVVPEYKSFKSYRAGGGYDLLRSCLRGERSVEPVAVLVDAHRVGQVHLSARDAVPPGVGAERRVRRRPRIRRTDASVRVHGQPRVPLVLEGHTPLPERP